jgi:hypothetical protein
MFPIVPSEQDIPSYLNIRPATEAATPIQPTEEEKAAKTARDQSISDRANLSRSTGISEDLFYENPEVDSTTGDRTYTVIGQLGPGVLSPAKKYTISSPKPAAVEPPPPPADNSNVVGKAKETPTIRDLQQAFEAAPTVGVGNVTLDPRMAQGTASAQRAYSDYVSTATGAEPAIGNAESELLDKMREYRTQLDTLSNKRAGADEARKAERNVEQAALARSQMAFDANRVYSDLANQPLQTGVLSFAAGLVQGLQGYAGVDKPNVILQSVDEAAKRDVMNQIEQRKRQEQGLEYTKNAYTEARQALGDEQQALQVAALATFEQYKTGLKFVHDRLGRAKERADVAAAIGRLDYQIGEAATKLKGDNATRQLEAQKALHHGYFEMQKLLEHQQEYMLKTSMEERAKGEQAVQQYIMSHDGAAKIDSLSSIGRFNNALYSAIGQGKNIDQLLDRGLLEQFSNKLKGSTAKNADNGVLMATAKQELANIIDSVVKNDPAKRAVAQELQTMYMNALSENLGKAQSISELANMAQVVNLNDPKSVLNFIDTKLNSTESYINAAKSANPSASAAWDNSYGTMIKSARLAKKAVSEGDAVSRRIQQGM